MVLAYVVAGIVVAIIVMILHLQGGGIIDVRDPFSWMFFLAAVMLWWAFLPILGYIFWLWIRTPKFGGES